MTYQDLLTELQTLSQEELNQTIYYHIVDGIDLKTNDQISLEEVDSVLIHNDDQVCLMV